MNVLLVGRMAAAGADLLDEQLARLGVTASVKVVPEPVGSDDAIAAYAGADVIVGGPIDKTAVRAARRLKLFHVFRGGADGLGLELLGPEVQVANTYHHQKSIADFVLMAILIQARRGCQRDRQLRRGDWTGSAVWAEPPEADVLDGKMLTIVGLGRIGGQIAARARAFGLKICGVSSRMDDEARALVGSVVPYERLRDVLPESDWVVACCRLSSATTGLFSHAEFAAMKESAFFINVARGTVVDEKALYESLATKRIAGAAIDVWYQYPTRRDETRFPSAYLIHELPNVFLSPHCSSWTRHMLSSRVIDVAENIRRVAAGEPLLNALTEGSRS